jgi:ABC-2 type transport system permease protein
MKTFYGLFVARTKEFIRDRGSLGWTFLFPFIVIAGFAFGYKGNSQTLFKVDLLQATNDSPLVSGILDSLKKTQYIQFIDTDNLESAVKKVRMHQIDLLIKGGDKLSYWVNPDSSKGRLVETLLLASNAHPEMPGVIVKQAVPGREIRYVEWLIPGILAMNMMFSSLFGVGYTIVRYRKNGVLKRLKATPVTAFQFLAAQLFSRLILIMLTSFIVFFGSIFLVGFKMQGSYVALFTYLAVGAGCMISLGLIFASRIASEELAEGLLNLLTWPMMFLSGIWFSLEGASPAIVQLSKIFPITYIVSGARQIMLEGATLSSLTAQMGILAGMGLLFLAVGSLLFKWN